MARSGPERSLTLNECPLSTQSGHSHAAFSVLAGDHDFNLISVGIADFERKWLSRDREPHALSQSRTTGVTGMRSG